MSDRAASLHDQAGNCLALALRERDEAHAAELIDEAVRLARRSRELTGAIPRSTRGSG